MEKAEQNWIRYEGDRFRFPGGGTMFPNGADAYIDDIGKLINLADGSIRTAIDTGCGVSFYFFQLSLPLLLHHLLLAETESGLANGIFCFFSWLLMNGLPLLLVYFKNTKIIHNSNSTN